MRLFKQRLAVLDLPEICGRRLSVAEVKQALGNQGDAVAVRAVLQLLWMTRQDCGKAAQDEAWKNGNPNFHLGGQQGLDDLLVEIANLLAGKVSDDVKAFFAD